jgi:Zn-dependent oligopeptidase
MLYDYSSVTPQTVTEGTDAALAEADALVAQAEAAAGSPSFETVVRPLELALGRISEAYGRGAFLAQASTDPAVRDAGQAADERMSKWRVGLPFREALYAAVAAFDGTDEAAALTGEQRRLLDFWLRDFRRAGQGLPAEARAELERLRARLIELEVGFQRNVNEYSDAIEVTKEQLAGVPQPVIDRLSPGAAPDTWRVSLDYPELNPFLEHARDRDARRDLHLKFWNQAVATNRPILAEALRLRQRIADLLGHPTWAHFATEVRMAGSPQRIHEFYDEIRQPVAAATAREVEAMEAVLREDGVEGPIGIWDWRYYDQRQRNEGFGVDSTLVSEYLPLDDVLRGLFRLTGEVFGLSYRRVDEARAWHPSVELYEIHDSTSGELLAHFYMDLFPREGKFGHAAAFPLQVGYRDADGSYVRPISAILANFSSPGSDRPSLLQHTELVTLFHEFGHILHMSLTRAESARFSGAETEWDFVEAPSQIMQHWTWDPDVLARFARHYRTGEPIPAELATQLARARNLNMGIRTAIQIFYGTLDMTIHDGDAEPDLDAAIERAFAVTGLSYPAETFMLAGFAHLLGGYDAGYYGYLWAETLGDDMFSRFEREGVLSPAVGAAYRRAVLEPNGARSGDEMLLDFLGRPPNTVAWMRNKGFTPKGS